MRKLWVLLLVLLPSFASAQIGTVTSLTGTNARLERNKAVSTLSKSASIESNDLVIIGSNTDTEIKFVDKTDVKITSNSRLLIDDFVFDPKNADAGKLGLKVALGTVRYTSGQIAKSNPQQVNIKTPTATIAVRGTDFAMTVDEIGRSVIVMLPSCATEEELKKFDITGSCLTGEILVSTLLGSVTLNQPFTATFVTDSHQPPLQPVQLPMDIRAVSNNQILSLPDKLDSASRNREDQKQGKKEMDENEKSVHRESAITTQSKSETSLLTKADGPKTQPVDPSNPCYPFNECGNTTGKNYYYRFDEERGNVISIKTGERFDNVTYSISINSNDLQTKVIGDGSTHVTVRQWNR
jgi:hypothetical protein